MTGKPTATDASGPVGGTGALRVVGAVVVDDGRAFVIRRSPDRRLFPGCWDIPGGHVEAGETLEEALAREIEEETGWHLAEILAELAEERWMGDDGLAGIERDYLVRVEGDLMRPRLELAKHPEGRWVARDELDLLLDRRRGGDDLTWRIVGRGLARAIELAEPRLWGARPRPGG